MEKQMETKRTEAETKMETKTQELRTAVEKQQAKAEEESN